MEISTKNNLISSPTRKNRRDPYVHICSYVHVFLPITYPHPQQHSIRFWVLKCISIWTQNIWTTKFCSFDLYKHRCERRHQQVFVRSHWRLIGRDEVVNLKNRPTTWQQTLSMIRSKNSIHHCVILLLLVICTIADTSPDQTECGNSALGDSPVWIRNGYVKSFCPLRFCTSEKLHREPSSLIQHLIFFSVALYW